MAINKVETENYLRSLSTNNLMELKAQLTQLKNSYYQAHFKDDAVAATVSGIGRETINDIKSTIESIDITSSIPDSIVKTNQAKAQVILDTQYVAPNSSEIESINLENFIDNKSMSNLEKSKSLPIGNITPSIENGSLFNNVPKTEAELTKAIQKNSVSFQSKEPLEKTTNVLDILNHPNREKITALTKACIPCKTRKLNFKVEYTDPFAKTLTDLEAKWNKLKLDLASLFSIDDLANSDLCELLKFLDAQCIPDLLGLMSLLGLMLEKYQNLSLSSWNNALNMVLGPFLTPVIGSLVTNLDQYVDLIIAPLICVVNALENQAYVLDANVSGMMNAKTSAQIKYKKNEIAFLEQKEKNLTERLQQLNQITIENSEGTASYPEQKIKTTLTSFDKVFDISPNPKPLGEIDAPLLIPNKYRTSNQEELNTIEKELRDLKKLKNQINSEVAALSRQIGKTISDRDYAITNKIKDYGQITKGSILQLVATVNEGISIVKQTIDVYRDELQRIIMGRVSTQSDQIEYTRSIQKIKYSLQIVKMIYDMAVKGKKLQDMCSAGEATILGELAKASGKNPPYDFYRGTDDNGNSLMITVPSGAVLNLTSINLNPDKVSQNDLIKTVATVNDLQETSKLNQNGILPNIGNVDNTDIQVNLGLKGELDLHFKSNYSIMKNDFCSKSPFNFGSAESVASWAAKL